MKNAYKKVFNSSKVLAVCTENNSLNILSFSTKTASNDKKYLGVEDVKSLMVEQVMEVPTPQVFKPSSAELLEQSVEINQLLETADLLINANELNEKDLILCLSLFVQRIKESGNADDYKKLLNNVIFHKLLKTATEKSYYMPSSLLSRLFLNLVNLKVPINSNLMNVITINIYKRINDMFLEDISIINKAITFTKSKKFFLLHEALKLHLLNYSKDELFFKHCLSTMNVRGIISLFYLTGNSKELQKQISKNLKEVILDISKNQRVISLYDAFQLIDMCKRTNFLDPFILRTASLRIYADYKVLSTQQISKVEEVSRMLEVKDKNTYKYGPLFLIGKEAKTNLLQ